MSDAKPPSRQRQIEEFIFVRIPHVLSGTLFLIAVVLNIVNVIGRYVFGMPVFWAEEALTFTVIWIVFLVVGAITYRGAHLNMDLLYSRMPAGLQLVVRIAIALALDRLRRLHGDAVVDGGQASLPDKRRHGGHQYSVGHPALGAAVRLQLHGGGGDRAIAVLHHRQVRLSGARPCVG